MTKGQKVNYIKVSYIALTAILIVALGSITTNGFINSALGQQTLTAELTGGDEVPPVATDATGTFNIVTTNQSSGYLLSVDELANATAAHIHRGEEGENGKIVVTLYNATMPANLTQGLLSQGNITADNLEGPLAGQQLTDLIDIMDNGTAYVNVHTKDFPLGEIRGQISSEGVEPPSGLTGALLAGILGNRTSVPDNITMSTP